MRFGSVAFFKVLIKTVLCIAFFVPLVLCVIFAVVLWNKGTELDKAKADNEKLTYMVEMLSGEREATVEGFYDLFSMSGLSEEALIGYIESRGGTRVDRDETQAGPPAESEPPDDDLPDMTMQSAETEGVTSQAEETAETESAEEPAISPYASIHEDMQVSSPKREEFVREQGTVYLTFDDGPSENTYSVLYYLKQYGIKATFFVVPHRTESCYALLRQIAADGHSIGVHSATHEYTEIYASVEAYLEDFYEAWDIIYDATGIKTEIFRFPGGSVNDFNGAVRDDIINEMTRRGFRYYDWNVDSHDAGGANWSDMYNSVPADIAENYRSVVLMHDSITATNTVYVLEDILKVLVNEGYKFDKINNNTHPCQFTGPFA